jgi:hypothetical protein
LPPDILFQRDSPARSKREIRGDIDTVKINAGQVINFFIHFFSSKFK